MRLPVLAVLAVVVLGSTACSSEPLPYDDGSQAVPLAGLGPQLADAGVMVVSADVPVAASADDVVAALGDAGFDDVSVADPGRMPGFMAANAATTAGLLGVAGAAGDDAGDGNIKTFALVFDSTSAAAVFAASGKPVLADEATDDALGGYLAGNVVGYATPGQGRPVRLRHALLALGADQ